MFVLGVSCSPRIDGNTQLLVKETLNKANENGAQVEYVSIAQKHIEPCRHCLKCFKKGACVLDDEMQEILDLMLKADAIIIGTPVCFLNVTGQAKILMDRTFGFTTRYRLANKIGAGIIIASSMGHSSTWMQLNSFFWAQRMRPLNVVMGFARKKEEVKKDKHAFVAAGELGRKIVQHHEFNNSNSEYELNMPLYRYVNEKKGIDSCPASGNRLFF